jgi:hypothetical protein
MEEEEEEEGGGGEEEVTVGGVTTTAELEGERGDELGELNCRTIELSISKI